MSVNAPLLGARQAAQSIALGTMSSQAYVESLLAHIEKREPTVRAWAHFDREQVLAQARWADAHTPTGPLHGVPIGWKDVIDCAGLPTGCNSPIHRDHHALTDAAAVAMTRRAGAMVMGKTVTAEFAASHPGPTTHPLNANHTPGGSSSGSAAAVAAGMVALAVGTQTGGSVIRPAAFCGVVGFKPSFGMISRYGIKQLSDSFDTVGTFARSVDDTALLMQALTGRNDFANIQPVKPSRVLLCRTNEWHEADACMHLILDEACRRLAAVGVATGVVDLPAQFGEMTRAHHVIEYFELARALQHEYLLHSELMSQPLRNRIESGLALDAAAYERALALREQCQVCIAQLIAQTDLLLTPAAPGEAPLGLASTGKATFNRVWTALGLPALSLPFGLGPVGLPLGIQLIANRRRDAHLLAHGAWIERLFNSTHLNNF
jgi:amidase